MVNTEFKQVKPHTFIQALEKARQADERVRNNCLFREATVYGNSKCFLVEDNQTGFAVTAKGELISLFNLGGRGLGTLAVSLAKEEGATHLECDAGLMDYYGRFGFKVINVQMRLEGSDGAVNYLHR